MKKKRVLSHSLIKCVSLLEFDNNTINNGRKYYIILLLVLEGKLIINNGRKYYIILFGL